MSETTPVTKIVPYHPRVADARRHQLVGEFTPVPGSEHAVLGFLDEQARPQ